MDFMSEPFIDLHIHTQPAWSYIGVIAYSCYSVLLLSILFIHGKNMYQDLFTIPRMSVKHRRQPPAKTALYKLMLMLCQFSIFFYFIADTCMIFNYFMTTDHACYVQQTISGVTYHIAKTWMYILFLSRLYTIYKPSAFAYSLRKISISAAIIVCYGILVIVAMIVVWKSDVYPFSNGIHHFPNYCDATLEPITGAMMTLEDMSVSFGFLTAFIIPLRKTIKLIDGGANNKATIKIQYAGMKNTILTAVAMVSTFICISLVIITGLNFFIGLDPVINSICMVLMTPYYPQKYYQQCCGCCIKYCDKSKAVEAYDEQKTANNGKDLDLTRTNTTQATVGTSVNTTKSIDTMDQLEKTTAIVNPKVSVTMMQAPLTMQTPPLTDYNPKVSVTMMQTPPLTDYEEEDEIP